MGSLPVISFNWCIRVKYFGMSSSGRTRDFESLCASSILAIPAMSDIEVLPGLQWETSDGYCTVVEVLEPPDSFKVVHYHADMYESQVMSRSEILSSLTWISYLLAEPSKPKVSDWEILFKKATEAGFLPLTGGAKVSLSRRITLVGITGPKAEILNTLFNSGWRLTTDLEGRDILSCSDGRFISHSDLIYSGAQFIRYLMSTCVTPNTSP